MKKILFKLYFAMVSFSCVESTECKEVLIFAADQWCPISCDPTSERPGYMVEILREVFDSKLYEIKYDTQSWSRALSDARDGKITGVIGALRGDAPDFIFPKREQGFSESCFYTLPDSKWKFTGISSLSELIFGASKDYSYSDELDAYIKEYGGNLKRIDFVSGDEPLKNNLEKLKAQRIQAFLEDSFVLKYSEKTSGASFGLRNAGCIELKPMYVAFSPKLKTAPELAHKLSEGMKRLKTIGKLRSIMKKYGL